MPIYRGEATNLSRGRLADRIMNEWKQKKLLLVDREATLTLNALAAGYALPLGKGGRPSGEPESGTSRLVAEALECMVVKLDTQGQNAVGFPDGAHLARAQAGQYMTIAPNLHPHRG